MNEEDLYNGITNIRDDQISAAEELPKSRKSPWLKALPIAAAFILVAAVGIYLSALGSDNFNKIPDEDDPAHPSVTTVFETSSSPSSTSALTSSAPTESTPPALTTEIPATVLLPDTMSAEPGSTNTFAEITPEPEITKSTIPKETVTTDLPQTESSAPKSELMTQSDPEPIENKVGHALMLASPNYPETVEYREDMSQEEILEYYSARVEKGQLSQTYSSRLGGFTEKIMPALLSNSGDQNRVCSPLNLYLSLAMLTEITDGSTKSQLLDLLDCQDEDALRETADAVYRTNYTFDPTFVSKLANSLWLSDDLRYFQPPISTLSETYRATVYSGRMGSGEYDEMLRSWADENTGGLLEGMTSSLHFDPETVISLASTVYFSGRWSEEFSENMTETGIFHTPSKDVEADFMHAKRDTSYFRGDHFSAINLNISDGPCSLWLFLPDEGVSTDELINSGEITDFLSVGITQRNSKFVNVNMSIPKFDVMDGADIKSSLKALGVADIFDPDSADFSPLVGDDKAFLSGIMHDVRVKIDEEGIEGAALTVSAVAGDPMPPDEKVDFILDRPFVFAVTTYNDCPIFAGVVNEP